MKTKKSLPIFSVIASAAILLQSCSSSSSKNETISAGAENTSKAPLNLYQSMVQIRADANPQTAFLDYKTEHLKADQPVTLQFIVGYINERQPDQPQVSLKLVELNGDQLNIANGEHSTVENTIISSSIKCTPEELKKIPRQIKAGLNFIHKDDLTPVFPVTPEFEKSIKVLNKDIGYPVISASSSIENEIGYLLTGNYHYWDQGGLYSEASFEKSKFSDDVELQKFKFYLNELENGSLKEILKLYQSGKLALVEYQEASDKKALDPQTILTITGSVTSANFQYPLIDKRDQQYAELILGLSDNCKITEIKLHNKNFIAMVQSSNVTGDGIGAIKKKLEFYAKNKPVNDPNAERDADNSWESTLEQQ
jgi:PBP1b-binding outer membrane lipoprotein LpoB